jgi:hypothetical protein
MESLECRSLMSAVIASGETITAALVTKTEVDTYTIAGVAGGTLMASVGETTKGSLLTPDLEIHAPGGALLSSGANASGLTLTARPLAVTGTYTVVVKDYYAAHGGGYAVTAVSVGTGIMPVTGGDAGPTISGVTKSATIGVGDIDAFTIHGVAGGSLLTSVGETTTGSSLTPSLEIYSPSGALLTNGANAVGETVTARPLAATGTYTVIVRDYYGTGVGGYNMTAVSIGTGMVLDPGGDAGPTTSGVTKSATIGIGDIDAFTIQGVAGGSLLATAAESIKGSSLTPSLEIYSPSGALLTNGANAAGETVTARPLAATGTYTVVVRDYYGTGIGGYNMTAVSIGTGIPLDPGGDAGPTISGDTKSANIGIGDIDAFTIHGVAGGSLLATAAETVTGSSLTPSLEIYSPSGALLTNGANAAGETVTARPLAVTGTYTVVVRDYYGTGIGGFNMTAVSIGTGITLDSGGDAGATTSGTTRLAAVGVGDIDAFTIQGVAGGSLLASAAETVTGSSLTPSLEIYSPSGALLTNGANAVGETVTARPLAVTGTYTVVVRDYYGTGIGAYAMTALSVGPGLALDSGGDGGPIASGVTRNASISTGDIDASTFYAVAGEKIVLTVSESVLGSSLTPSLELYGPTGALVTNGANASTVTLTIGSVSKTGFYTCVVRDYYGTGVGGYALKVTVTA